MHGDGASFAPVVHLYIGMVLFGYTYQVHPRDENAVLMAVSFTFETSQECGTSLEEGSCDGADRQVVEIQKSRNQVDATIRVYNW